MCKRSASGMEGRKEVGKDGKTWPDAAPWATRREVRIFRWKLRANKLPVTPMLSDVKPRHKKPTSKGRRRRAGGVIPPGHLEK